MDERTGLTLRGNKKSLCREGLLHLLQTSVCYLVQRGGIVSSVVSLAVAF